MKASSGAQVQVQVQESGSGVGVGGLQFSGHSKSLSPGEDESGRAARGRPGEGERVEKLVGRRVGREVGFSVLSQLFVLGVEIMAS